ncbi:MAG: sugar ABC transporter permease [Candidatus Pristimantibacillus lignocellulolyticus]|uniref:Sugar ABC transporter permease n=1 Tax=Candidatus Pristimantibacillus lignocellulolyticus TaxID=2994561 RepID=A0A9J6ZAG0_9BACL|nr:MAG: sugar ABC transporter permease [Candidatus Pristimantibacillus lignocellulolyticus]
MKLTRLRSYKSLMAALIFLAPFMILYVWFWIYPIFKGFISSFNSGIFGGKQNFVGLDNYSFMLSDPKFWSSFGNTIYFIVISTPAIVVLGLILALLVNMKLKGTTILRTVYFMPFMLSVSVMGSIWMFILQSRTGLISEITRSLGMKEISFLGSWEMGWMSILIATIWWTVGFNMMLFLAGLQEIPEDIYEASDIDGAGGWKKFWYITMPSLKGVTALVIILQSIASFKLFGQTWLITKGGPGTTTTPLVHYIYQIAFRQWDMGYASAVSFVLFLTIAFISLIQFKFLMKD